MAATLSFVEVCLFGLVLYLGFYFLRKKRDPRYPPGPPSLPIIGNLLQLGSETQKVFIQWAEKYGNVFSFKMGTMDVIMLNDAKSIREVFAEPSSAGRSPNPILVAFSNGSYGIAFGEGVHWEQQRRFSLRTLRDLGFAKTSMEGIILAEADTLCRFFEKRVNQPLNIYKMFNSPVINVLWNIVSGERHEWEGPETPKILRYANDVVETLNKTTETGLMYAPALRHIAPDFFGWTDYIRSVTNLNTVCKQAVAKHVQNLDPDSPKDLIDHYLIEMKAEKDPASSFYKETGDKNLQAVIPDLFIAGSETTDYFILNDWFLKSSNTLSWLMVFLAEHQHVLKKVQAEIDNMVGLGRQPSITDRPNTPYTEATIYEILRRTSVVNNGIPHKMLQDAVISGYFFPKNATVISNIFRVHNNPKVWGDPENFRPERFLSEDRTKLLKNDNLIPFSVGKRFCLGEPLARDTLYLFLTSICQKFDINSVSSEKSLETIKSVEPKNRMLNEPMSCDIIVSLRKT